MPKTFLFGFDTEVIIDENIMINYRASLDGSMKKFTSPVGLLHLFDNRFYDFNLEEVVLGNSLLSIGRNAFRNNTNLSVLNIPKHLESVGDGAFQNCTSLVAVELPNTLDNVGADVFRGCSGLEEIVVLGDVVGDNMFRDIELNTTTLVLDKVKNVGEYAFYNMRNVTDFEMPNTLENVGNYAFYYLAYNKQAFALEFTNRCDVGSYAFRYANINGVEGILGDVGEYAFANLNIGFNVKLDGVIGNYAFANNNTSVNFEIDSDSNVTSLGTYAFQNFGANRNNPSENKIIYDFGKSTFRGVPTYAFSGSSTSASNRPKYFDIIFPESVGSIAAYSFRYAQNFNLYLNSAPTLTNANAFDGCSDYKIYVHYDYYSELIELPNWISLTANIAGYVKGSEIGLGKGLPTHSKVSGKAFTWYDDETLTNVVTSVGDVDATYYAIETGLTREMWYLDMSGVTNTIVEFEDTQNNIYSDSSLVPAGETLTLITAEPIEDYTLARFSINGIEADVNDTFIVDQNITVSAFSYTGEFNLDWESATPAQLKVASQAGQAYNYPIGSTKTITLKDNTEIILRLVDNEGDKVKRDDDSYNGLIIEFQTILRNNRMNASSTNDGGWKDSEMRSVQMEDIYNLLPNEWQSVISLSKIVGVNSGTDGTLNTTLDKLWLPASKEVISSGSYARSEENNALQTFAYYRDIATTDTSRIKQNTLGNNTVWWLRSPYSGNTNLFVYVTSSGSMNINYANSSYGVAVCFAI